MKSPLAIDLCAGERGWAQGFEAAGWIVLGIDKRPYKEKCSPPQLVRDITTLDPADFRGLADLVLASPPCEEFSKWDTHSLFPGIERPDLGLVNCCFEFAAALGLPIVLENVRGLQKLIGAATQHYGSFYLWGDVPTLMPYIPGRQGRPKLKWTHRSPRLRAKIPYELAYTVANYHRVRLDTGAPGGTGKNPQNDPAQLAVNGPAHAGVVAPGETVGMQPSPSSGSREAASW